VRRSVFTLLDHHPESGETLAALHATALEQARLADRLGFSGLWLAEHHFQKLGTAPNPAVVLAAIAACTQRLRLGPAVSVLPLRDPILVAEDYALVDVLSGGRLDMGVGTGSQPLEFEAMACDFERRQETFRERLAVLLERWRAAAAGERGPKSLNVAPLQSPAPPLYVAAMHEESAHAIGLAGHSLLTLASPATRDLGEVSDRIAAHTRGLAEGGHPEGAAEPIVVAFAHVAASEDEARAVAAPALGRLLRAMLGVAPEDPEGLYRLMRERDTGLFGSAEHVAKQLERYARAGVGHVAFVTRFGGMDASAAEGSLRRLAPAA
jgi:alkanesulfonate monooxygenase SsuD/methylene tetrahydromethanopterin reductase-like flavin-dependent oxidoreductase (luciferase family)